MCIRDSSGAGAVHPRGAAAGSGDWQLRKLENGYLSEIGEPLLTEESTERLRAAVEQGHIRFLLAYRGCRAVGMCSVAENFSTFCCGPVAVLEDLYVEPVFRRQGIARQLIRSAQALCRERGVGSLTVCCAPCDEAMYQACLLYTSSYTARSRYTQPFHPRCMISRRK